MMARYAVNVRAVVHATATLEIEAPTKAEAERLALAIANLWDWSEPEDKTIESIETVADHPCLIGGSR